MEFMPTPVIQIVEGKEFSYQAEYFINSEKIRKS